MFVQKILRLTLMKLTEGEMNAFSLSVDNDDECSVFLMKISGTKDLFDTKWLIFFLSFFKIV